MTQQVIRAGEAQIGIALDGKAHWRDIAEVDQDFMRVGVGAMRNVADRNATLIEDTDSGFVALVEGTCNCCWEN